MEFVELVVWLIRNIVWSTSIVADVARALLTW
jgi:hypothetical protein